MYCMHACLYVCKHVFIHLYMCEYICIFVCVCKYVCMKSCMYMFKCLYVCVYVCVYVCIYVCGKSRWRRNVRIVKEIICVGILWIFGVPYFNAHKFDAIVVGARSICVHDADAPVVGTYGIVMLALMTLALMALAPMMLALTTIDHLRLGIHVIPWELLNNNDVDVI